MPSIARPYNQSKAARYEIAVHMANELNLRGEKRKQYIENKLRGR